MRIGDVVRVKLSPDREALKPYAGERAHVSSVDSATGYTYSFDICAIGLSLIDRPGQVSCYSDEVDVLEAAMLREER